MRRRARVGDPTRQKTVLGGALLDFDGFLAWLTWIFVHIFFLIGFRNRVLVLIQWAWSYLTYSRGARLITEEVRPAADSLPAINTQASQAPAVGASSRSP